MSCGVTKCLDLYSILSHPLPFQLQTPCILRNSNLGLDWLAQTCATASDLRAYSPNKNLVWYCKLYITLYGAHVRYCSHCSICYKWHIRIIISTKGRNAITYPCHKHNDGRPKYREKVRITFHETYNLSSVYRVSFVIFEVKASVGNYFPPFWIAPTLI